MLKPALAIFSMVASCKLPFGRPNLNFLLIQIFFNATPLTREQEAQRRKYHFDDSFPRVTGLICQVRRGKATFFFSAFSSGPTRAQPATVTVRCPAFRRSS